MARTSSGRAALLAGLAGVLLTAGVALSQEATGDEATPDPATDGTTEQTAAEGASGEAAEGDAAAEATEEASAGEAADPLMPGDPGLVAIVETGEGLYLANCRPCHGTNGTAGVPLAGNEKVSADYGYLVWAILTGPGYMPEFHEALTDQEIADMSTYILNSWGNEYGQVMPEDVAALR